MTPRLKCRRPALTKEQKNTDSNNTGIRFQNTKLQPTRSSAPGWSRDSLLPNVRVDSSEFGGFFSHLQKLFRFRKSNSMSVVEEERRREVVMDGEKDLGRVIFIFL